MTSDPYTEPFVAIPVGENVLHWDKDGSGAFTVTHEPPEERSNIWKGTKRIAALSDDAITVLKTRPSGVQDYVIDGVSVSWRGLKHGKKREWFCHGHRVNRCPHSKRLRRFREEHSVQASQPITGVERWEIEAT